MRVASRWLMWIAGGLVLGVILVVAILVAGYFTRSSSYAAPLASPEITIVVPPTATATLFVPTSTPIPTETPTPVPPPQAENGIQIGAFVEVTGTEGDGLRLREQSTLNAKIAFLALENEIFEVREGPRQNDGYEWYFLINPYNSEKEGWAVSNYLRPAEGQ